ncbi:hypothetical protein [Maribacter arcticus]|uniref:Uncharacterized protein n=1 Tax=Maribacter arcticus TaxID=561365 RepID=A0A1T5ED63_9FLAO|nr:hypothetical protein [Maribacter arcticus]SKB81779.1 hypothetical protein SAMN05660866_03436 [Maribacter arcticus]
MKTIGIRIRKINVTKSGNVHSTSKKNIKKQILTLHRKIKKKDKIETEYVIEKDDHKGRYHSHLVIHYNDEKNLYNQLNRFIGGSTWISENSGFDEVKTNNGKWSEISLHNLYDVEGFIGYMNKYNPSETFY